MESTSVLDASARIIRVIEDYSRQTTDNQDLAQDKMLHTYLKHQLSTQDWKLWQDLLPNQQASLVSDQDKLPDTGLSGQAFLLLLSQYKRAGFELAQSWDQAQLREPYL